MTGTDKRRPLIVADRCIPFLRGRLEPFAEVRYIDPDAFTHESVKDADGLLIRTRTQCNHALLHDTPVRFIATGTIGTDQIDMPYCFSRCIDVHNAPGCNAPGVAQYVWASLLHLGIDPSSLTLGIVGCGNVGSVVAEWGRHLGANILVCDTPRSVHGEPGEWHTLEEVLGGSDVVSLHVPLTRVGNFATYHMIGEREISLMRPGSILLNAARGAVVDNEAFARAVHSGRIRAIVDTWEGEPHHINRTLLQDALIATPHVAGYSLQGKQRATRMIVEACCNHFGFEGVDLSGLAERYTPLEHIEADSIRDSYNPMEDTRLLRRTPEEFEKIRDSYDYRPEPLTQCIVHNA